MAIKVSCKCGQNFMAKDELEGQTMLCPKCHQPLTITKGARKETQHPNAGGLADLLEEAGVKEVKGPRCPKCSAPLKPEAVLCVACGFELQSGKRLKGASVRIAGERGHAEVAQVLLAQAADRIKEDKLEEIKTRKQGLPAWVYFLALVGLGAFAVSMFTMPKQQAFEITGWVVVGFGGLWSTYYAIRILIVAFREGVVCGLLYLFLPPFYALYYIFTRWDRCGGLFLYSLVGIAISGVGYVLVVGVAPMMVEKASGEALLPVTPQRQVVVVMQQDTFHTWVEARL